MKLRLKALLNNLRNQLGKTRDEVLLALGEPDAKSIGTRKYPLPLIFKYKRYELTFMPDKYGVAISIMDSITHKDVSS